MVLGFEVPVRACRENDRDFKSTTLAGLSAPLAALWWARKGAWDTAHRLVMDEAGRDAAWVHAYLHRLEGDRDNARYWYRQARRPEATGAFEDEWQAIVDGLLQAGSTAPA